MGLVFCQHTEPGGRQVMAWRARGDGLLGVRVALGVQLGPSPAGDLADAPVQGAQAHGGPAQVLRTQGIVHARG